MAKKQTLPPIRLRGVRQNNLKGFDVDLPPHRLIVITGLSGSGKSSLAFDTLYAEGQRRYIETFSPYARQFFDRMDKPAVDSIENIPPAIALEQCNTVRTTRSTVGTLTEICDYMKVLWPHLAVLYCQQCSRPVQIDTPQLIWQAAQTEASRTTATEAIVCFDLPLSDRMPLQESMALVARQGYQRLWWNNELWRLESLQAHWETQNLRPTHLTVVQDRLRIAPTARPRFVEACEQAYHFGQGRLTLLLVSWPHPPRPNQPTPLAPLIHAILPFSRRRHCPHCNLEYPDPSPARFSFNHPLGACPECKGFGRILSIDYRRAIPDPTRTLAQGVVRPWLSGLGRECQRDLLRMCRALGIPTDVPFCQLKPEWQQWVVEGDPDYGKDEEHEWPRAWYGVRGYFRWLETKTYKMHVRVLLSRYRTYIPCPACHGTRFRHETLLYRLPLPPTQTTHSGSAAHSPQPLGLTLADFYALPVRQALQLLEQILPQHPAQPHDPLSVALHEVRARLQYLDEVGLGYLTLDRPTRTLSGGETERVNLTACLGTQLVNTLFVLDEPSVGLHPRDTERLVRILQRLRDTGNTVVVVEHDPAIIRAADHLIELGPGRGTAGGQIVFQGTYRQMLRSPHSLTGQYLAGHRQIPIPTRRPVPLTTNPSPPPNPTQPNPNTPSPQPTANPTDLAPFPWLVIRNATRHNLRNLTVALPLQRFVCLTGVSGSGKSTLVREVLVPALADQLPSVEGKTTAADWRPETLGADAEPEEDASDSWTSGTATLEGWEALAGWAWVDQSPLGRTPRSNPAVYIGAFEPLRELFAACPEARAAGYRAAAFSFNSAQGQCERCRGAGFEKVEMQFLSDVFIRCPECHGRRYRPEILQIKIAPPTPHAPAWSVADLLEATVDETLQWLEAFQPSTHVHQARSALRLLQAVGLGYLRLGQPLNTLSGGESQRLKLVRHLAAVPGLSSLTGPDITAPRRNALPPTPTRGLLFLFDEPTTGLHFDDIRILLEVFQRLVDAGHSLLVIEHNLEVIKCADWVVDLGPEAGDQGGRLVVAGPPEAVAACPESHTGRALREVLPPTAPAPPSQPRRRSRRPLPA